MSWKGNRLPVPSFPGPKSLLPSALRCRTVPRVGTRTELNQTHERAQPANKWEPRIQPLPWLSFVGVPFKKGSCTFEGNTPKNPPGRLNRGRHFASKVVHDTNCVAAAWVQCNHLLVCLTGTTTGIVDRSMAKWFRTSAPIKTLR